MTDTCQRSRLRLTNGWGFMEFEGALTLRDIRRLLVVLDAMSDGCGESNRTCDALPESDAVTIFVLGQNGKVTT